MTVLIIYRKFLISSAQFALGHILSRDNRIGRRREGEPEYKAEGKRQRAEGKKGVKG
jgi:hypothetical protein